MQVIKFVTKDFKSPGLYRQLDYSKFGIPIEVEADPKRYGQCAKGIHVVPINKDADFKNVIFTDTMILLEVAEEDIVYCEGNGKMRVRKATPVRQVVETDKEWGIIRTAACQKPSYAYGFVRYADKKPTDETRTAACKEPSCAYFYAVEVDQKPTDEIRTAVCQDPECAYMYARDVDRKPTKETRTAACKDPYYAYMYARDIDQKPTAETRTAACNDPECAYVYARDVDKNPTSETRIGASKDEFWKGQYEQWRKELNWENVSNSLLS
jgi:hypothetical protein